MRPSCKIWHLHFKGEMYYYKIKFFSGFDLKQES